MQKRRSVLELIVGLETVALVCHVYSSFHYLAFLEDVARSMLNFFISLCTEKGLCENEVPLPVSHRVWQ